MTSDVSSNLWTVSDGVMPGDGGIDSAGGSVGDTYTRLSESTAAPQSSFGSAQLVPGSSLMNPISSFASTAAHSTPSDLRGGTPTPNPFLVYPHALNYSAFYGSPMSATYSDHIIPITQYVPPAQSGAPSIGTHVPSVNDYPEGSEDETISTARMVPAGPPFLMTYSTVPGQAVTIPSTPISLHGIPLSPHSSPISISPPFPSSPISPTTSINYYTVSGQTAYAFTPGSPYGIPGLRSSPPQSLFNPSSSPTFYRGQAHQPYNVAYATFAQQQTPFDPESGFAGVNIDPLNPPPKDGNNNQTYRRSRSIERVNHQHLVGRVSSGVGISAFVPSPFSPASQPAPIQYQQHQYRPNMRSEHHFRTHTPRPSPMDSSWNRSQTSSLTGTSSKQSDQNAYSRSLGHGHSLGQHTAIPSRMPASNLQAFVSSAPPFLSSVHTAARTIAGVWSEDAAHSGGSSLSTASTNFNLGESLTPSSLTLRTGSVARESGNERTGMDGVNVYIRGLDAATTDQDLWDIGKTFGTILSHKAIVDLRTNECKGYGFIMYETEGQARDAMLELSRMGLQCSFAKVGVEESFATRLRNLQDHESSNVYMSNLPLDVDEERLSVIFGHGGLSVISQKILRDSNGMSRGVGFVRFDSRSAAQSVIDTFHGVILTGGTAPLQVRFADSVAQKQLKGQVATRKREVRMREGEMTRMWGYPSQQGSFVPIQPVMPSSSQAPRLNQLNRLFYSSVSESSYGNAGTGIVGGMNALSRRTVGSGRVSRGLHTSSSMAPTLSQTVSDDTRMSIAPPAMFGNIMVGGSLTTRAGSIQSVRSDSPVGSNHVLSTDDGGYNTMEGLIEEYQQERESRRSADLAIDRVTAEQCVPGETTLQVSQSVPRLANMRIIGGVEIWAGGGVTVERPSK
ncbi:hypothetical protein HDU93_009177 [Gonapodya sp. JEL0774]|nr:hypothetical protein HDU93_009177 [Gonapodya sp. JEL0774]